MPAYKLAPHTYLAWFAAIYLMLNAASAHAGTSSGITLAPAGQYVLFFKQDIQKAQVVDAKVASAETHKNRLIVQGTKPGQTQVQVKLAGERITRSIQVEVIPTRITAYRLEQPITPTAPEGSPQANIKWLPLPSAAATNGPHSQQAKPSAGHKVMPLEPQPEVVTIPSPQVVPSAPIAPPRAVVKTLPPPALNGPTDSSISPESPQPHSAQPPALAPVPTTAPVVTPTPPVVSAKSSPHPRLALSSHTQHILSFPQRIQSLEVEDDSKAKVQVSGPQATIFALEPGTTALKLRLEGSETVRTLELDISPAGMR